MPEKEDSFLPAGPWENAQIGADMREDFYGLWYQKPAASWIEALPIGNGKLGAMLEGGIQQETITINEDTVWDGTRRDRTNPDAYDNLVKIREAIFRGDYGMAGTYGEGMLGKPMTLDSYQPLCKLEIRTYHTGIFRDYKRGLDLNEAVHTTEYRLEGGDSEYGHWYSRKAFVSNPDRMMVMCWDTDDKRGMDLDISMSRMTSVQIQPEGTGLLLKGQCREGGIRFAALVQIRMESGTISEEASMLRIRGAGRLEFRIAGATDFRGEEPEECCRKILNSAERMNDGELLERHRKDYRRLYHRQHFSLGQTDRLPAADVLLQDFREGKKNNALYVLMYDYLRYQMICSSRPGTMPSNLQGIWNDNLKAPWNSDFHPNANLEINYWPAEGYGLPECVEPLVDWLWELVPSGMHTARTHYHAGGWVLHHISDIFGCTTPMDGLWGLWPFGGSWLCRHVYDHYLYTGDKQFLADKALPLIEGAVQFMLDFLIECPQGKAGEGCLITCPSHSPENRFLDEKGEASWLTYASTMDMELIWDLFTIYLDALKEAGASSPLAAKVEQARSRLVPIGISRRTGGIREWIVDYEEEEPGHRHVSHLFALYPGNQITESDTELLKACEKTLERRLSHDYDGKGWSYGWLANLFARLKKGNRALEILNRIAEEFLLDNLMINAHGNPQAGDAQAFASAIQEMLVHSESGCIRLLPALPDSWPWGCMEGMRARGGIALDLYWGEGALIKAVIKADYDREITIQSQLCRIITENGGCVAERDEKTGMLSLSAKAGVSYILI